MKPEREGVRFYLTVVTLVCGDINIKAVKEWLLWYIAAGVDNFVVYIWKPQVRVTITAPCTRTSTNERFATYMYPILTPIATAEICQGNQRRDLEAMVARVRPLCPGIEVVVSPYVPMIKKRIGGR